MCLNNNNKLYLTSAHKPIHLSIEIHVQTKLFVKICNPQRNNNILTLKH